MYPPGALRASIRGVPRPRIPRTGKAKNEYLGYYFDLFLGKTKYCFKVLAPFHKPVLGAPLASTLVSRSTSWTYPPPPPPPRSSPSFLSLSSTLGFAMGVSISTCYFYEFQSSLVVRVGFLTWSTNALDLFQNNPNYKKLGCRNMEVNVGNQSWVHWSM